MGDQKMKRLVSGRLLLLLALLVSTSLAMATKSAAQRIELTFFWSSECPHCHNALPFLEKLAREDTGLTIRSYNLNEDPQYFERYREMAAGFGQEPMAVPAFFVGNEMIVGYDNEAGKGAEIIRAIRRARGDDGEEPSTETFLDVPILGRLDAQRLSLPALTLLIGFLDAFNPCAFFVLLFLLSLVGHARSRGRILLIGGVFVATSGVVYFGFMAAWFNAFLLFGEMSMLTRAAGVLAIVVGAVHAKDYFWFRRGLSLSIPEGVKPGLFRRMRNLTAAASLPVLFGSTIFLALVASAYEILCTVGLPMVFTRVLTLHALSMTEYYGYLLLYNIVYVLPLLAIVLAFAFTMTSRKLQEGEGRFLKLVSGMMMLALGTVLLVYPPWLTRPLVAIGLVAGSLAVAFVVASLGRAFLRWRQ
ncbi:glutaredoxin [Solidesulfovibrio fructosivorans JJ]]|uniref:Glutaredoxin n=2 Tax=Solidesulfovibrio fructosivorans TaxID=878 RepID=E1JXC5_SOLFR|nr:glutaredoxin [Solidesulfovibrio fructosivorans JJ]]